MYTSDMRPIRTTGQIQVRLEAALEHFGSVRYSLSIGNSEKAEYHLKAIEDYVQSAWQAMAALWGSTEGQLCPYDDCAYNLALRSSGWWQCPHCKRNFWVADTDSDIENYRTYRQDEVSAPMPAVIPIARDLGPSWASPSQES